MDKEGISTKEAVQGRITRIEGMGSTGNLQEKKEPLIIPAKEEAIPGKEKVFILEGLDRLSLIQ